MFSTIRGICFSLKRNPNAMKTLDSCTLRSTVAHLLLGPKLRDWSRDESRKCFAIREEVGGREGIRTPDPLLAKRGLGSNNSIQFF